VSHATNDRKKLRAQAEAKIARDRRAAAPDQADSSLLHELQVHQVELEMQNEELRRAHAALEVAHEEYVDLYEFSPVGYLTLDRKGQITRVNLAGAALLGLTRVRLQGRSFARLVATGSADRWHRIFAGQILGGAERADCDLVLRRGDGSSFDAHVACRFRAAADAGPAVQIAITDVTEQKRALALALSPERMGAFRAAMDALPIGVIIVELSEDGKPRFITQNSAHERMPRALSMSGAGLEDLPYKVFRPDRTTPIPVEDWPGPRAARTGEAVHDAEFHTLQEDRWRVLSVSAAPVPTVDPGEPRRAVTVLLDITDRVEQARQVEEVKARLSHVIDGSSDGFFDLDLRTGHVKCSRGFASMLGYDLSELETDAAGFERLVHPDDRERDRAEQERHLRGESEQYAVELRLRHKEGRWIWFSVRAKIVERGTGGQPLRVAGTLTDITLRRRVEEALRVQQAQLDIAARSGGLGLWELDLATNQAWRTVQHDRLFGYDGLQPSWSRDEALRHVVPEDRPLFNRAFDEALATGHFHYELRIQPAKGALRWIEASGEVIRDEAGKPVRMAGTVMDVTERRLAEERDREASRYFRSLIEASIDPFVIISPEGKITDVNAATEAAAGVPRERIVGTDFAEAFTEPERARAGFRQVMSTGAVRDLPLTIRHASGRTMDVLYNATVYRDPAGQVQGVFAAARDVSVLRSTQEQLAIASRLAAMGRLVAGLAHQVNNPLAAQLSGQRVALEVMKDVRDRVLRSGLEDRTDILRSLEHAAKGLEDAQAGGQRIARIVKDLSIFGRPEPRRSGVPLAELVGDALRWMPGSVSQSCSVQVKHQEAPDVLVAPAQIEQVIVHLITNAAKAAIPGKRGEIVIRTGPGTKGMARLEVADRGAGIDPAIVDRVFEPFFTTRPVGDDKGTGLGLAVSHAIVTAHGGTLSVKSTPGKGTTFRMELPVAPREVDGSSDVVDVP
jgi:PAS domain S-box-containing protein